MRQAKGGLLVGSAVVFLVASQASCESSAPVKHSGDAALLRENPFTIRTNAGDDRPTDAARHVSVLRMAFLVERILVPDSLAPERLEEAWRFVDERATGPELAAHLLQNGFRVGIANRTGMAAMRTVLVKNNARHEAATHEVPTGSLLTLDLGQTADDTTVFAYDARGSLSGKSFSAASKYFHVDYNPDFSRKGAMRIRVTPELYKSSDQPQYREQQGELRYETVFEGTTYYDLAVELSVGPDEWLVIGSASNSAESMTLGHQMLTARPPGASWTMILAIHPQPTRLRDVGEPDPVDNGTVRQDGDRP